MWSRRRGCAMQGIAAAFALIAGSSALGDPGAPPAPPSPGGAGEAEIGPPDEWRVELKHVLTNRAAIDQSSRTTLRVERLRDATLALLRLDVPYVDKNNAFASDPTNAGLGDLKARLGLRPVRVGASALTGFGDLVFPTAVETPLGMGKYQLGPGVSLLVPVASFGPALRFVPQVQQVVSVAGDPDRKPIDYTAFEAKLAALWPDRALLSVNPKPVVDWTSGVRTAAVVELEADWLASRAWRLWVKAGTRLWGPAIPTTYDHQVELAVRLTI